jgi:hypothetical protein
MIVTAKQQMQKVFLALKVVWQSSNCSRPVNTSDFAFCDYNLLAINISCQQIAMPNAGSSCVLYGGSEREFVIEFCRKKVFNFHFPDDQHQPGYF